MTELWKDIPGQPGFVRSVLDSLVKKKRATVEMTDDGPRYTITQAGIADAS